MDMPDRTAGYPHTAFWEPKVSREDFSAMLQLQGNPSIPAQLEELCDCGISTDWAKRSVKIGANDRPTTDLVFKKLAQVQTMYRRSASFIPVTKHLVHIDDNLKKFEFKLVALSKQQDKWRTTLWHYKSKRYDIPTPDMYTVRVVEYRIAAEKFINVRLDVGPVYSAYKSGQHRAWRHYKFLEQEPSDPELVAAIGMRTAGEQKVSFPIIKPPEEYFLEWHAPLEDGATTNRDGITTFASETDGETSTGRARSINRRPRSRSVKGRAVDDPAIDSYSGNTKNSLSLFDLAGVEGEDPPIQITPSAFAEMHELQEALSGNNENESQNKPEKDSAKDSVPPDGGLVFGARPTGVSASTITGIGARSTGVTASIATGAEPSAEPSTRRKPKSRNPTSPKLSAVVQNVVNTSEEGRSTGIIFGARPSVTKEESSGSRISRKPREKKEKHEPLIDVNETVETVSEVDSRKMRNTMRQQAPSGAGKEKARALHNGQNDSLKLKHLNIVRLQEAFGEAFEQARIWPGRVDFEIKLGRVTFTDLTRSLVKGSIDWTEWEHVLRADNKFRVLFSEFLTTEAFDAEFIADLRLSKNEYIFWDASRARKEDEPIMGPNHCASRVTYEFHITHKGKTCMLTIDAETFEAELWGEKKFLSSTDLCCAQHSWDARFILTGSKSLNFEVEPYRTLISSFSATGGKFADISFSLLDSTDLLVKKIWVKKETRHPSIAPKVNLGVPVNLVVSEYQELEILRNKTTKRYRAAAAPRDDMVREGRLGYTFALVPIHIEKALQKNRQMEVGETAPWTMEDIIGQNDLWSSLYHSVTHVLRRVDDVGFHNNSPSFRGPRKVPGSVAPPGNSAAFVSHLSQADGSTEESDRSRASGDGRSVRSAKSVKSARSVASEPN